MEVALSFNLTWIEHLGTLTPCISITKWGNGHFGEPGALEGDGRESRHSPTCPGPGEGLSGHL